MEKPELHRRLKRLYILVLALIILVIVNQFFAGGLFDLIPPVLKTTTPGPTRPFQTSETGPYPVETERGEDIPLTSTHTPTAVSYPVGEATSSPTSTHTPEAYPVESSVTNVPTGDSYP